MASKYDHSSTPSTPRKIPHCRQCKRPRAGHPRSGCPYGESPPIPTEHSGAEPNDLTDKLNALCIGQSASNADESKERQRRRPLATHHAGLNPTSPSPPVKAKPVVEESLHPGSVDARNKVKGDVSRWTDSLVTPTRPKVLSAQDKRSPASQKQSKRSEIKPLERTLSTEERENFFGELAKASLAASIFSLNTDQVEAIQQGARKVGLYARVVAPSEQFHDRQICWLVLGNDEKAVKRLFDVVKTGLPPEGLQPRSWVVAGGAGAIAGAIATWTGLAMV